MRVDPGMAHAGVKVTHPERVIDATTGITKLDLVRYYESVADWMRPHPRRASRYGGVCGVRPMASVAKSSFRSMPKPRSCRG
ncbi:hypothetical protein ACTMU2_11595 [Cupriavidus basilensis]